MPILLWPFRKAWTPEDYRRVAEEQLTMHARRGGVWKIFTDTDHGAMLTRANRLRGIQPLDLVELRKHYQKKPCE